MEKIQEKLVLYAIKVVLKNPEIMLGLDTTLQEVELIIDSKKIPLSKLHGLGSDYFFFHKHGKLRISENEGKLLDNFFYQINLNKDLILKIAKNFVFDDYSINNI